MRAAAGTPGSSSAMGAPAMAPAAPLYCGALASFAGTSFNLAAAFSIADVARFFISCWGRTNSVGSTALSFYRTTLPRRSWRDTAGRYLRGLRHPHIDVQAGSGHHIDQRIQAEQADLTT